MLWAMTWKNLWRNKARSLVVICAIASGIWGGLIASAAFNGIGNQIVKSAVEYRLSDLQLHRPGFTKQKRVQAFIPEGPKVLEQVRSAAGVKAAAGRIVLDGLASSAKTAVATNILGIDPAAESQVTRIKTSITKGDYLSAAAPNTAVIGEKLAKRLGLRLRSKIVLSFQGTDGPLTGGAFRVVGLYNTGSSRFDETTVFVNRKDLASAIAAEANIHEIAVVVSGSAPPSGVAEALRLRFPEVATETWQELAPELDYVAAISEQTMGVFIGVILAALGFGIVNTILMAVLERSREFAMLMAVGMQKRGIVLMVMLETLWIAVTGGVIGVVAAFGTLRWLGKSGINLGNFQKGLESLGVSEIVYPALPPSMYPTMAVSIVFLAVAASLYPALRASRVNPVELLRDA